MQITMLNTRRMTEDGFAVRELQRGETYDLADHAARRLVRDRQAQVTGTEAPTSAPQSPFGFRFGEGV